MGLFMQDGKKVQIMSKFFFIFTLTKRFDFFRGFSTVLESFCPVESKNGFVLVLTNLFD